MKFLLDTCTVSDFVKGQAQVLSRVKETSPALIAVSTVTVMEIEYGLQLNPQRARQLNAVISDFLGSVHILPYTVEDARATAAIRAALKSAGTPVGYYDVMIAGAAVRNGLALVTSNTREFSQISGLRLENWR